MKFLAFLIVIVLIVTVLAAGCQKPCQSNWQCTPWTQCNIAGIQTRTCSDLNSCGSEKGKPIESQSCTPQTAAQVTSPIVGHPYSIKGVGYDSDPSVPSITTNDIQRARQNAVGTIVLYTSYTDLYNQYHYRCFSLKNEGTQAFTTAQAATTGTSSREQLLYFYSVALDTIGREENCQRSISVFSNLKLGFIESLTINVNQLNSELNTNIQISNSDENKEISNYNSVASNFNGQILKCNTKNQVIGTDGLCHDICYQTNRFCPTGSTCFSGQCYTCLPGFQLIVSPYTDKYCIQI